MLPVYNGELYVREAIESVLAQTEGDFELLIGNDNSMDRTRELLAGFRDPRIRIFHADRNRGQFGNLNWLLQQVQSPIVKFLCHDDTLFPKCLAEHVAFFARNPDALMSMCQAEMVDDRGNFIGQWPSGGEPVVYDRTIGLQILFYHGCAPGSLSAVCVRREGFDRVGSFDDSFHVAGDYDMWVRLCSKGCIGDLQRVLIRERNHGGRVTFSSGAGVSFVRERRRIRESLVPLLPERVRRRAERYVNLRQNVLDTHHFVTCICKRRFKEAWSLCEVMGRDLLIGLPLWLLTANNHLYKPKPIYVKED